MDNYIEKTGRFEFKLDNKSGMLIGMDGCHYNTEGEAFYYGQLGGGGSGKPKEVHQFILNLLSLAKNEYDVIDYDKAINLIKGDAESAYQFIFNALSDRNVIEYGSSVYGSWLTERGDQMLEAGNFED